MVSHEDQPPAKVRVKKSELEKLYEKIYVSSGNLTNQSSSPEINQAIVAISVHLRTAAEGSNFAEIFKEMAREVEKCGESFGSIENQQRSQINVKFESRQARDEFHANLANQRREAIMDANRCTRGILRRIEEIEREQQSATEGVSKDGEGERIEYKKAS